MKQTTRCNRKPGLRLLYGVLAALTLFVLAAGTPASGQVSGAIFTTDSSGFTINGNIYTNATDVYLNGGPQNLNFSGLPDGTYYFQVTDPSGATLLSTDEAVCRQLTVANGVVSGAVSGLTDSNNNPCSHANGNLNTNNNSTTVQLSPFSAT